MSFQVYIKENLSESFGHWRVGNSLVALCVILITAFGYGYVTSETSTAKALVLGAAVYFGILTFVITPAKMWSRAQEAIEDFRQRAKPELQLVFEPDKPVFVQEVLNGSVPDPWERRYRVGIRNDSSQVISGVRVVLESFEYLVDGKSRAPDTEHSIPLEHALNIMGRDDKHGLVDVSPGDRPTAYADVMAQRLNGERTEGDWMYLCYAAGSFTPLFSRGEFVFTLRVEGGGTYSRARFKIGATLQNRRIEMTPYR